MIAAGFLAAALLSLPGQAQGGFNTEGFRLPPYRAATPPTVPHGQSHNVASLTALLASGQAVLVDVQSVAVRPETREFGLDWLPNRPRNNLPGSHWLPNVGLAELEPEMERYFREQLARITGGDHSRALVFYCVVDCWMSWNAVLRAHGYGYRNLHWFPGGTEAWAASGGRLVVAQPVPLGAGEP